MTTLPGFPDNIFALTYRFFSWRSCLRPSVSYLRQICLACWLVITALLEIVCDSDVLGFFFLAGLARTTLHHVSAFSGLSLITPHDPDASRGGADQLALMAVLKFLSLFGLECIDGWDGAFAFKID
jgi:hypothetical protein